MKTIAVLTSGGDSPGMNAAIRASVRASLAANLEVYGARNGFSGLVNNDFVSLKNYSVTNILQRGGTILGTSRSGSFETKKGRSDAAENLISKNIQGLATPGIPFAYLIDQLINIHLADMNIAVAELLVTYD